VERENAAELTCSCNVTVRQALDEGAVGMRRSGRRLVIAPPSLAYDQENKHGQATAGAVVAFEIEVVRVGENCLVALVSLLQCDFAKCFTATTTML